AGRRGGEVGGSVARGRQQPYPLSIRQWKPRAKQLSLRKRRQAGAETSSLARPARSTLIFPTARILPPSMITGPVLPSGAARLVLPPTGDDACSRNSAA